MSAVVNAIREAVILLDRGAVEAKVLTLPNGDTVVFPCYPGSYEWKHHVMGEPEDEVAPAPDMGVWDAEKATDVLGELVKMKGWAKTEAESGDLDSAIEAITDYVTAKVKNIGPVQEAGQTRLFEVGRRNSASDQTRIQGAHDLMHDLGAIHEGGKTYPGMPVAEADVREAVTKSEGDAGNFPAGDYAYVPDATAPSTWKLRLTATPGGPPDPGIVGAAAAALGPGFRGQKVDIPSASLAAVRAKVRTAWRKANPDKSPQEMPDGIREALAEAEGVHGPSEDIRFREASYEGHMVTLAEAQPMFDRDNRVVWITPIKPGWGNSRDNNYYPASTLQEAVEAGLFDHLKMFRDHPRKSDEKELPERSVKDWFATTREAVWDAERQLPRVPVKVHDDDVYRRFDEAPEQIAFSILGGGSAKPFERDGRKGKFIEGIQKVRSVDWVTEAGAGGAIDFAESATTEEFDMDIDNLTADQLREANPKLYEHLVGLGKALAAQDREETAAVKAAAKSEAEAAPAKGDTEAHESEAESEPETAIEETDDEDDLPEPAWAKDLNAKLTAFLAATEPDTGEEPDEPTQESAATIVAGVIAESTLPKSAKDTVEARFTDATIGEGGNFADEAAVREAVQTELAAAEAIIGPFMKQSKVTGLGTVAEETEGKEKTIRESVEDRLSGRLSAPVPKPDRVVFTAEEMTGSPAVAAAKPGEPDPEQVSESAKSVQDRLATKLLG